METTIINIAALLIGFALDATFGDPNIIVHPIVVFGKTIAWFEKLCNKGKFRFIKGALVTLFLVILVYASSYFLYKFFVQANYLLALIFNFLIVFFCLSGLTLRNEVTLVFKACDTSLAQARKQLARIVGRDTQTLSLQQIRIAALESLSENLSDGVIAPLFWYILLGAPAMLTYKLINTFDSMIGYKNERYIKFGKFAAKLDDIVNFIPARITAIIMLIVSGKFTRLSNVFRNGKNHTSPNSGYPEAALASILNCRFGGPNYYFGEMHNKAYIGDNDRTITTNDLKLALRTNKRSEYTMLIIGTLALITINLSSLK